jgi:hypothetical protein
MVYGRPVAIFALNQPVLGGTCLLNIFFVTFLTIFSALVLGLEIFPLINIAQTVKIVSETFTMDPEIIRNYKVPGDQNQGYGC